MRALALFALLVAGCGGSATDPGLAALLRVAGAQYHPGAPPESSDGPAISSFADASSIIRAGELSAPLNGIVPRETTALAIWLTGDPGYWIITPGAEDAGELGQLDFSARLSFSPLLPAGGYTLVGRAANGAGHFGPPSQLMLTSADNLSASTLLVSLRWDAEADLDLHLVTPDGTEIWADKINSFAPPAPGQPSDPNAYKSGGVLDFDSNANCVIDGRRLENIYWTVPPPSGHYTVRVDSWSLCGVPDANWRVAATLGGASVGSAAGFSLDSDAALPHGKGAGVTALELDVP